MILLFKLIVLTFIPVIGLKIAFSKGMILEGVGLWAELKVENGHKVYDLFICPWCMSSAVVFLAHGFAFGLGILSLEWNWQLLIRWPLVVMGSSFLCGMTWTIYETISQIHQYFKNINDG